MRIGNNLKEADGASSPAPGLKPGVPGKEEGNGDGLRRKKRRRKGKKRRKNRYYQGAGTQILFSDAMWGLFQREDGGIQVARGTNVRRETNRCWFSTGVPVRKGSRSPYRGCAGNSPPWSTPSSN